MRTFMILLFSGNTWFHYAGALAGVILSFWLLSFGSDDLRMNLVMAAVLVTVVCLLVEAVQHKGRRTQYPTLTIYTIDTLKDLVMDGLGIWTGAKVLLFLLDKVAGI